MSEIENEPGVQRVLLAGDTTLDPLGRLLERGQEAPRLRSLRCALWADLSDPA